MDLQVSVLTAVSKLLAYILKLYFVETMIAHVTISLRGWMHGGSDLMWSSLKSEPLKDTI